MNAQPLVSSHLSIFVIIQHPNYFRQIGPVISLAFRRAQILLSNWTKLLNNYLSSMIAPLYVKLREIVYVPEGTNTKLSIGQF